MRQMLFNDGAEAEAIDAALHALRPIFFHHCKHPLVIETRTKEETINVVSARMRQQITGLMTEIAQREVLLWRHRAAQYLAEPRPTAAPRAH